jgi:hypothetical protein
MGILEILDLQKVWNEQKDFFEEQTKWFIENDLKHPLGVMNNE